MRKPVYHHPDFVICTYDKRIPEENKRLWLKLRIDDKKKDSVIVILKNPSIATKDISDKTIYNVTSYIFRNRNRFKQLKNIGEIIILNLIPFYETYSDKLMESDLQLIDEQNTKTIKELCSDHEIVIAAWGDHPKGLMKEYDILKEKVIEIFKLCRNDVYFIDKLSKSGNPKHGMTWGYKNELKKLEL